MRHLLHLGLFAAALAASVQASADDDSDYRRETRVVVARDHGPRHVRTVRVETPPVRVVYDARRPHPAYRRTAQELRRDYYDQRQDLEQIRRIARRWERAVSYRDYPAMRIADARLSSWLDREIYEATHGPHGERYAQRLRAISDELAYLDKRAHRGHGHGNHYTCNHGPTYSGHPGRGHGHAHGRAKARFYSDDKARIFDELIRLSERQVRRAQANLDRPVMWSYAYR